MTPDDLFTHLLSRRLYDHFFVSHRDVQSVHTFQHFGHAAKHFGIEPDIPIEYQHLTAVFQT